MQQIIYTSQTFADIYRFTEVDETWLREQYAKEDKPSWVILAAAIHTGLQPSMVWYKLVDMGLIVPDTLQYTERVRVEDDGQIMLPPLPEVARVQLYEGQTDEAGRRSHFCYEHVWAAAQWYGPFVPGTRVLHLNFCNYDNRKDNLWTCTGAQKAAAQDSAQEVMRFMVRHGFIWFDRDAGRYYPGSGVQDVGVSNVDAP